MSKQFVESVTYSKTNSLAVRKNLKKPNMRRFQVQKQAQNSIVRMRVSGDVFPLNGDGAQPALVLFSGHSGHFSILVRGECISRWHGQPTDVADPLPSPPARAKAPHVRVRVRLGANRPTHGLALSRVRDR